MNIKKKHALISVFDNLLVIITHQRIILVVDEVIVSEILDETPVELLDSILG